MSIYVSSGKGILRQSTGGLGSPTPGPSFSFPTSQVSFAPPAGSFPVSDTAQAPVYYPSNPVPTQPIGTMYPTNISIFPQTTPVSIPAPVERYVQVPVYVDRYVEVPVERPVYIPVQQQEQKPNNVGIGLSLERADGDKKTTIERIVRGFSAEQDGQIQIGDEVVAINDIDVRELSMGTIKQLTVGPEGSSVKLDMLRGAFPYSLTLRRTMPTATSIHNADAAGVLVHGQQPRPLRSVPDGASVRMAPQYSSRPPSGPPTSALLPSWSYSAPLRASGY